MIIVSYVRKETIGLDSFVKAFILHVKYNPCDMTIERNMRVSRVALGW